MRKYLVLLLAGALAPAAVIAQERDVDRDTRAKSERSTQRDRGSDARQQRSHSAERADRNADANRPTRSEDTEKVEQPGKVDRPNRVDRVQRVERPIRTAPAERDERPVGQVRHPAPEQPIQVGEERVDSPADTSGHVGSNDRAHDDHGWSKDWRHDHRYDWHHHRSRHGSLYRLGRYYDPYGWNYRRWSIGFSLWPSYYGSNYWLNDPWMYRLPPVYGPYRWVRYYDDALLVNIYTGQVVDVIYNFFW